MRGMREWSSLREMELALAYLEDGASESAVRILRAAISHLKVEDRSSSTPLEDVPDIDLVKALEGRVRQWSHYEGSSKGRITRVPCRKPERQGGKR